MVDCLTPVEIQEVLAGTLPPQEAARAKAHLAECESCQRALEAQQAESKVLDDIKGDYRADTVSIPSEGSSCSAIPDTIEGYEILSEIHRGGQGVVYKAIQKSTKRTVALKVLLQGPYASPRQRHRFEREVDLVTSLQHPNIVTVYESGITRDQRHYFAMEYIHGQPLDVYLFDKDLSVDQTLRLFQKVCAGVNHAHQRGVIHRDLKPSNIRIDANGEPHILDFGLARAAGHDLTGGAPVTVTGQFMGTLAYASPEQTQGDPNLIDIRTDIYSLGVILYEMLTGTYPYQVVGQIAEVFRNIAAAEPERPSTLRREIDNEVETIILKALAKEKERRYQSAEAFGRDIEHYLTGEPIDAKRDSFHYMLRKQLSRYKLPVAIAALLAVVVTSGLITSLTFWSRAAADRDRAILAEQQQSRERGRAEAATREAAAERDRARAAEQQASARMNELRWSDYVNRIALADLAGDRDEVREMSDLLESCPPDLRGWEWYRLARVSDRTHLLFKGHTGSVSSAAFNADGSRAVSGSADGTLMIWDPTRGAAVQTLRGHEGEVLSIAISPDAEYIVSGSSDKTVRVWDSSTRILLRTLVGHAGPVNSVALRRDGDQLVSGSDDGSVRLWNIHDGRQVHVFNYPLGKVRAVAFSPDGQQVACGGAGCELLLYDVSANRPALSLPTDWPITSVVYSRDGRRLAAAGFQGMVTQWDCSDRRKLLNFVVSDYKTVDSVCFSPDGSLIVTCGERGVKLWDSATAVQVMSLPAHHGRVNAVAFRPDGRSILAANEQDTLTLWDIASARSEGDILAGHIGSVSCVVWAEDCTRIVSGSADNTVNVWDADSKKELVTFHGHTGPVTSIGISSDGRRILSASRDKTLRIWDLGAKSPVAILRGHNAAVIFGKFTVDGKRIVSASTDGTVKLWDTERGIEIYSFRTDDGSLLSAAIHPNGQLIAGGALHESVKIWNLSGKKLVTLHGHSGPVSFLAFSPDGARLLSGSADRTLRLWDCASGTEVLCFRGHTQMVLDGHISPDGRRIVSTGADGTLKIWNGETGDQVLTLAGHEGWVTSAAFSPDGKRIASGASDHTVRVWDTSSRQVLRRASVQEPDSLPKETELLLALTRQSPDGVAKAVELVRTAKVCPAEGWSLLIHGEYLILGGEPENAVAVIQQALDKGCPELYGLKSLGWALLSCGRSDEAKKVFRRVPKSNRSTHDGVTVGYFLDEYTEAQYASQYENSSYHVCFPWFYVGQRMEIEGKPDRAIEAYRKCAGSGRYPNVHYISNWAAYRLKVLTDGRSPSSEPAAQRMTAQAAADSPGTQGTP